MSPFARNPLNKKDAKRVCDSLQTSLVLLLDLSLVAKQAHWNVFGPEFLSLHVKLDDVVATARSGSDTVAERMAQLGCSPDGRAETIGKTSALEVYPEGFQQVDKTLQLICDALHATSRGLRDAIREVGDIDPLTEDQLIAIGQEIEEHLWMLQAMEAKQAASAKPAETISATPASGKSSTSASKNSRQRATAK